MSIAEIEDIRKRYSRSRKGPWSDPVAYPEMCRKTVARNHAKSLPMSTDLDTLMRRDDDLYDVNQPSLEPRRKRGRPPTRAALDQFAGGTDNPEQATDAEVIEHEEAPAKPAKQPRNFDEYREHVALKCAHATDGETLRAWFVSDQQRNLRNAIGLVGDETGEMRDMVDKRIAELGR